MVVTAALPALHTCYGGVVFKADAAVQQCRCVNSLFINRNFSLSVIFGVQTLNHATFNHATLNHRHIITWTVNHTFTVSKFASLHMGNVRVRLVSDYVSPD